MLLNLTFKRLVDIVRDAEHVIPDGWLFLPENNEWMIDTKGVMLDADSIEESEFAKDNNLIDTLDGGMMQSIYVCAARLEYPPSDRTLLEAFIYYYRFDAFLPTIGAEDPPQIEVIIYNMDRQFYDSLGQESLNSKCKQNSCNRGTVNFSVFCRVHHFESIKQKTCPFDD